MFKPYLNLAAGGQQNDCIQFTHTEDNGVFVYRIKGLAKQPLDADFSAGIDMQLGEIDCWMANYKYCTFWCKPSFGTALADIPDRTQALLYRKKDGMYGVVLPLVSDTYKCILVGGEDCITAKLLSWYDGLYQVDAPAFVWAEGSDPYALLENCTKAGTKALNNGCCTRQERRYPEIFEYLGWCSWDAFQINVDEEGLVKKCAEFKEKNIPVKWAIIDDMWGEVRDFYGFERKERGPEMFSLMHSSKLYSFAADPKRFPQGLSHCIDQINQYGITVGIWHPTTGYWRGIDPAGKIAQECKDYLLTAANGVLLHHYQQDKAYMFYSAYHDYLKACGAKFVKIDNQSAMSAYYRRMAPIGQAAREYHKGMEASVGQHFENVMINCMGMASEDMWNRSFSPLSRCSDDFIPEDKAWFTQHITQCTFNSMVQGQLYYQDYDMWWTDDEQATKNSLLRAVSGGPIYVSDQLGRSNREILMPLCLEDGRILRCDRPGMPTRDCLFEDPKTAQGIFKVQNSSGATGYIAAFNLQNGTMQGTVSPADVPGLKAGQYAVYEHFTKKVWLVDQNEAIDIALDDGGFALFVVAPVVDGLAVIGRTDKFISSKTVKEVKDEKITLTEAGEYAYVKNGRLYIEKA